MKTRTDVLNFLADKYKLQRYLELGVQVAELNFDKIQCVYKVGVDPDPRVKAAFCMTSDEFFDTGFETSFVNTDWETKFDIVFIDGMHTAEQVKKDFENSLKILSPNGFIVIHDCNPEKEEHTIVPRPKPTGHWNGDVYRFAITIASPFYGWEAYFADRPVTVDVDNGCLVYKCGQFAGFNIGGLWVPSWDHFTEHRKDFLNLISWDEFTAL